MKNFKTKLATVIIAILVMAFILPIQVLGADAEKVDYSLQMIKTDNGDYIVYIKDLQNTEFKFAITQSPDTKEIDLNYEPYSV